MYFARRWHLVTRIDYARPGDPEPIFRYETVMNEGNCYQRWSRVLPCWVFTRVADRLFFLFGPVHGPKVPPRTGPDRTGGPKHVANTCYVEVLRSTYLS